LWHEHLGVDDQRPATRGHQGSQADQRHDRISLVARLANYEVSAQRERDTCIDGIALITAHVELVGGTPSSPSVARGEQKLHRECRPGRPSSTLKRDWRRNLTRDPKRQTDAPRIVTACLGGFRPTGSTPSSASVRSKARTRPAAMLKSCCSTIGLYAVRPRPSLPL
jgi:hypothetical protein